MAIQMTDEQMQLVKEILQRHLHQTEVWIFGSRFTSKAKHYSDLDLLIKGKTPLSLETLYHLSEDFSESTLPFKVDLVDWHRISEEFRAHIETNKEIILHGKE